MKQYVLVGNRKELSEFALNHYTELESMTILGKGENCYLAEFEYNEDDVSCEVLQFIADNLFVMSNNKKQIVFNK